MKLLVELVDFQDMDILEEQNEKTKKKKIRIKAPMLVAEEKNRNGRTYPKQIIEREVQKFNEEKIKRKNAYGHMDHPTTPEISGKDIAIHIDELKMDGNVAVGIASILNTVWGNQMKNVLEDGYAWGLSSRGLGTLGEGKQVQDDYSLITVDAVTDPSAYIAWADRIMESKEYVKNEKGVIVEKNYKDLRKKIDEAKNTEKSSELAYMYFKQFLNKIRG